MDSDDDLRERLARLHADLAGADLDPALRGLATDVMRDIARLVDTGNAAATPPVRGTAVERLEALTVEFEAAHPALAGSLRRLVDLLGEVGL